MKRLVKLLMLVAVIAALAALLRRRPAPPSASPTAPPTPVTPTAEAAKPRMPTMPKMPTVTEADPEPTTDAAAPWAEPTATGGCPDGHPVKAKASSKIFHIPGGVLYDKTVPDRCYASPEAAIADGFRQSLR
jgi:large subunit ribosomal protein L17